MKKDFFNEKYELDNNLWEIEKRYSIRKRYDTILNLYSILGIIVAIFGVMYFIQITYNIHLTDSQRISLLVSGVGIVLSITSRILLIIKREQRKNEIEKIETVQELSEFLWKWAKFEEVSKEILQKYKVEYNRFSIKEIIKILLHEGKIDHFDALILEESIQIRNIVVHKGKVLPKNMILKYYKKIDDIINKISSNN